MDRLLQRRAPLCLVFVACCGTSEIAENAVTSVETQLEEGDTIVASVDGVPITASRISTLVRESGRMPRDVVERLVGFELLAAEARRRGLEKGRDVEAATRQAMVQRYLAGFESTHGPDDMPRDVLQNSYKRNYSRFVYPKLRKVAHILVKVGERASEDKKLQAHALASKIAREAKSAKSLEAFEALSKRYKTQKNFDITFEVLETPVYKGARLVWPFIEGAMKLEKLGETSPATRTKYGSHVIYLVDMKEASNVGFDEALDEIKKNEHLPWLSLEFDGLIEELRFSTTVEGYVGQRRRADSQ